MKGSEEGEEEEEEVKKKRTRSDRYRMHVCRTRGKRQKSKLGLVGFGCCLHNAGGGSTWQKM